jgi:acyl-CoA synthetase (AMP-forming)/AMP-acid ligase II
MPVSSFGALLAQAAAARGPDPIIEFGDERVSLAQLDLRANQSARGLMRLGAGAGARIAIMLPDSPEFLYALFGAQRLGACAVPVPADARGEALAALLAAADARALVTHNDLHKYFRRVAKQVPALKRVAVSLRDASPVMKIFPGVDIMQDWFDLLSSDPPAVPVPKKTAPAVAFVDQPGEAPAAIAYGAGFRKVAAAAKLTLIAGDRIQPARPFSSRHFLTVTLPAALLAGAIISVPASEKTGE